MQLLNAEVFFYTIFRESRRELGDLAPLHDQLALQRALEDLNPRHQVLETCVLPTELRAHEYFALAIVLLNLSLTHFTINLVRIAMTKTGQTVV